MAVIRLLCQVCHLSFQTISAFKRHLHSHQAALKEIFPQDSCTFVGRIPTIQFVNVDPRTIFLKQQHSRILGLSQITMCFSSGSSGSFYLCHICKEKCSGYIISHHLHSRDHCSNVFSNTDPNLMDFSWIPSKTLIGLQPHQPSKENDLPMLQIPLILLDKLEHKTYAEVMKIFGENEKLLKLLQAAFFKVTLIEMYQKDCNRKHPLLGMQHLVECICEEMDDKRHYLCTLCHLSLSAHSIIKHVLSFDHIFCYFNEWHPSSLLSKASYMNMHTFRPMMLNLSKQAEELSRETNVMKKVSLKPPEFASVNFNCYAQALEKLASITNCPLITNITPAGKLSYVEAPPAISASSSITVKQSAPLHAQADPLSEKLVSLPVMSVSSTLGTIGPSTPRDVSCQQQAAQSAGQSSVLQPQAVSSLGKAGRPAPLSTESASAPTVPSSVKSSTSPTQSATSSVQSAVLPSQSKALPGSYPPSVEKSGPSPSALQTASPSTLQTASTSALQTASTSTLQTASTSAPHAASTSALQTASPSEKSLSSSSKVSSEHSVKSSAQQPQFSAKIKELKSNLTSGWPLHCQNCDLFFWNMFRYRLHLSKGTHSKNLMKQFYGGQWFEDLDKPFYLNLDLYTYIQKCVKTEEPLIGMPFVVSCISTKTHFPPFYICFACKECFKGNSLHQHFASQKHFLLTLFQHQNQDLLPFAWKNDVDLSSKALRIKVMESEKALLDVTAKVVELPSWSLSEITELTYENVKSALWEYKHLFTNRVPMIENSYKLKTHNHYPLLGRGFLVLYDMLMPQKNFPEKSLLCLLCNRDLTEVENYAHIYSMEHVTLFLEHFHPGSLNCSNVNSESLLDLAQQASKLHPEQCMQVVMLTECISYSCPFPLKKKILYDGSTLNGINMVMPTVLAKGKLYPSKKMQRKIPHSLKPDGCFEVEMVNSGGNEDAGEAISESVSKVNKRKQSVNTPEESEKLQDRDGCTESDHKRQRLTAEEDPSHEELPKMENSEESKEKAKDSQNRAPEKGLSTLFDCHSGERERIYFCECCSLKISPVNIISHITELGHPKVHQKVVDLDEDGYNKISAQKFETAVNTIKLFLKSRENHPLHTDSAPSPAAVQQDAPPPLADQCNNDMLKASKEGKALAITDAASPRTGTPSKCDDLSSDRIEAERAAPEDQHHTLTPSETAEETMSLNKEALFPKLTAATTTSHVMTQLGTAKSTSDMGRSHATNIGGLKTQTSENPSFKTSVRRMSEEDCSLLPREHKSTKILTACDPRVRTNAGAEPHAHKNCACEVSRLAPTHSVGSELKQLLTDPLYLALKQLAPLGTLPKLGRNWLVRVTCRSKGKLQVYCTLCSVKLLKSKHLCSIEHHCKYLQMRFPGWIAEPMEIHQRLMELAKEEKTQRCVDELIELSWEKYEELGNLRVPKAIKLINYLLSSRSSKALASTEEVFQEFLEGSPCEVSSSDGGADVEMSERKRQPSTKTPAIPQTLVPDTQPVLQTQQPTQDLLRTGKEVVWECQGIARRTYYICKSCEMMITSIDLYQHFVSLDHQLNYVGKNHPELLEFWFKEDLSKDEKHKILDFVVDKLSNRDRCQMVDVKIVILGDDLYEYIQMASIDKALELLQMISEENQSATWAPVWTPGQKRQHTKASPSLGDIPTAQEQSASIPKMDQRTENEESGLGLEATFGPIEMGEEKTTTSPVQETSGSPEPDDVALSSPHTDKGPSSIDIYGSHSHNPKVHQQSRDFISTSEASDDRNSVCTKTSETRCRPPAKQSLPDVSLETLIRSFFCRISENPGQPQHSSQSIPEFTNPSSSRALTGKDLSESDQLENTTDFTLLSKFIIEMKEQKLLCQSASKGPEMANSSSTNSWETQNMDLCPGTSNMSAVSKETAESHRFHHRVEKTASSLPVEEETLRKMASDCKSKNQQVTPCGNNTSLEGTFVIDNKIRNDSDSVRSATPTHPSEPQPQEHISIQECVSTPESGSVEQKPGQQGETKSTETSPCNIGTVVTQRAAHTHKLFRIPQRQALSGEDSFPHVAVTTVSMVTPTVSLTTSSQYSQAGYASSGDAAYGVNSSMTRPFSLPSNPQVYPEYNPAVASPVSTPHSNPPFNLSINPPVNPAASSEALNPTAVGVHLSAAVNYMQPFTQTPASSTQQQYQQYMEQCMQHYPQYMQLQQYQPFQHPEQHQQYSLFYQQYLDQQQYQTQQYQMYWQKGTDAQSQDL